MTYVGSEVTYVGSEVTFFGSEVAYVGSEVTYLMERSNFRVSVLTFCWSDLTMTRSNRNSLQEVLPFTIILSDVTQNSVLPFEERCMTSVRRNHTSNIS